MILYHGSNLEVKNPIIIQSEKGRDFGCAFYLTPIKEQAERMAKRKQRMNKSDSAIVSVFDFKEKEIDNFKYKIFNDADLEWLDLVIECRTNPSFKHDYDIVEGKKSLPVLLHIQQYPKDKSKISKLMAQAAEEGINSPAVEECIKLLNTSNCILQAAEQGKILIQKNCKKFSANPLITQLFNTLIPLEYR